MSEPVQDRLYRLLPAIHRIRDVEKGQPLRALCAILERELLAIEADIDGLYDNWFIETCDEWVVPYIGDLVKATGLHPGDVDTFSLRAYVANVLRYRRRKGTLAVLEEVVQAVSGWPSRGVEFRQLLATTQHVNHVRLENQAMLNLRRGDPLELLNGPFETTAHLAEVRHTATARGKYNIPNIGVFLWRLQSYRITRGEARPEGQGRYTFNPLGKSLPLFNRPQTEIRIEHLAEEINVPIPLRRRPLYRELKARREALNRGETPRMAYFGRQPVLEVYLDGDPQPVEPEAIEVCDLSDWDISPWIPPSTKEVMRLYVDPQLGRLVRPAGTAELVEVSYAYGFSADVGGGPYNRSDSLDDLFVDAEDIWWAGITTEAQDDNAVNVFPSLAKAIEKWNTRPPGTAGVISILDSHTYITSTLDFNTGGQEIKIRPGSQLLIVAARWRLGRIPSPNEWSPNLGLNHFLVADGLRPHLLGDIYVSFETAEDGVSGRLFLNGLLVEGRAMVFCDDAGAVKFSHCTLVPDEGGLTVEALGSPDTGCSGLSVDIERSICGSLSMPQTASRLRISESIVDAAGKRYAVAGYGDDEVCEYGPPTIIERSTIFGEVKVTELTLASEVLFTAKAEVERLQAGCVRYSYVSPHSTVPRRFRCQPQLALENLARELGKASLEELSDSEQHRIRLRIQPVFTSVDFGNSAYAQLSVLCPEEIRVGAEDGSEMGVFGHLKQAQREANVRAILDEYLRFGLEAGVYFAN